MTEHHIGAERPLIPMPPLTPAALRSAVAQIAPSRLRDFSSHLDQAAEQAAMQSSVAPLRGFLQYWGELIAVQRLPQRAARVRELEDAEENAVDVNELTRVTQELRIILEAARSEVAP